MELKIFDSILRKELRPWLLDTTDTRKFSALVKAAKAASLGTYADLQKQVAEMLGSFPALQKAAKERPPTPKAVLQPPLYQIHLPAYTDVITHFYLLLIASETLRVSNLLQQDVASLTDAAVILYDIKQALKAIRVLTKQVEDELRNNGYASVPDSGSTLTHFVLFALKQMLTALFFEMQERFKNVLTEVETEESFHRDILEARTSFTPQLTPTPALFEFHLHRTISENSFSKPNAVDLLKQIQTLQDAKLQTVQAALENLIFSHSQNSTSLADLTNTVHTAQHFLEAKNSMIQEINRHSFGHQRLEVVNTALSELDYIQPTPINKLSVPQKLYFWLQETKLVYSATASHLYSAEEDASEELKKNGKVKSKKSITTPEEHKQAAAQHLHFMSGANYHNQNIMTAEAFKRMMNYTAHLIDTEKVPTDVKQIPQINLPTLHIRYTFYSLHKKLYGTKRIKQSWIDFLHKVFKQFEDTEQNTTRTKFSTKPSSYDNDIKVMTR